MRLIFFWDFLQTKITVAPSNAAKSNTTPTAIIKSGTIKQIADATTQAQQTAGQQTQQVVATVQRPKLVTASGAIAGTLTPATKSTIVVSNTGQLLQGSQVIKIEKTNF